MNKRFDTLITDICSMVYEYHRKVTRVGSQNVTFNSQANYELSFNINESRDQSEFNLHFIAGYIRQAIEDVIGLRTDIFPINSGFGDLTIVSKTVNGQGEYNWIELEDGSTLNLEIFVEEVKSVNRSWRSFSVLLTSEVILQGIDRYTQCTRHHDIKKTSLWLYPQDAVQHKLFITLPCVGKTTLVKDMHDCEGEGWIDLDYHLNEASKMDKAVIESNTSFLNKLASEASISYNVFTFNGWVNLSRLVGNWKIIFIRPDVNKMVQMLADCKDRDSRTGGSFYRTFANSINEWVSDIKASFVEAKDLFGSSVCECILHVDTYVEHVYNVIKKMEQLNLSRTFIESTEMFLD